jgi:hypothetical protein
MGTGSLWVRVHSVVKIILGYGLVRRRLSECGAACRWGSDRLLACGSAAR